MPRLSLVTKGRDDSTGGPARPSTPSRQLGRRNGGAPLYRQVCDSIEALAMSLPLEDERPLPPEPELMAAFGVSRGTVRRAVDELVRDGLLRVGAGRGTFVVAATKMRWMVWDRLVEVARPDSRFDMDLSRFVPDFAGSDLCTSAVTSLPGYLGPGPLFLTPDNSLEGLRLRALEDGRRLIVPTFGMHRGFVLVDGGRLDRRDLAMAATLDGMERHGRHLSLDELRRAEPVGLVVTGAVAVTTRGLHVGGGEGYFDLEWGLLRHLGLASPRTTVVVVAHSCQVVDADVRAAPHDAVADIIVTPEGATGCRPRLPKPDGLFWEELRSTGGRARPYVDELTAELSAPAQALGGRAYRRPQ